MLSLDSVSSYCNSVHQLLRVFIDVAPCIARYMSLEFQKKSMCEKVLARAYSSRFGQTEKGTAHLSHRSETAHGEEIKRAKQRKDDLWE